MSIDDTTNNEKGTVSKTVARLSPAKRAVYDALAEHGAMTDDEIVERTGIKKGTSSPRRNDLVRLGLVEAVGKVTTPSGSKATKWGLVPPERIAEAMSRAQSEGPRRRPVTDYPLATRLEIVRQLLDQEDLNEAIRDQHGRAWSRVRGRANDRRGERNREMRENEAKLREAEERGSPMADFFKLRRILMQSNERVRAVERLVSDELERQRYGQPVIPDVAWPDVADLLTDLARMCDDTNARIREAMGVLGDDVIEGSVVEIDDFMLPEGDGSGEANVA